MLILVETRKPRTWLFRYQPIRCHSSACTSPANVSPSHACPCTKLPTMVYVPFFTGTYILYCFPYRITCTFSNPPFFQPVVSSFRRCSQSLSATTWYVASLSPIGNPLLNYQVTILVKVLVISMKRSVQTDVPPLPQRPFVVLLDDAGWPTMESVGVVDCPSPLPPASFSPHSPSPSAA